MDEHKHRQHPFKRTVLSSLIALGVVNPALAARYEVDDGSANNTIPGGSALAATGTGVGQAAVRAVNPGSHIIGEDVDVDSAPTGHGVVAQAGGAVELTGDNTRIVGSYGIYAEGTDSQISMDGGSIQTVNNAVSVNQQAKVVLLGVTMEYKTSLGRSISVQGGGTLEITGKAGIRSRLDSLGGGINLSGNTADTVLVLRDTDITTQGDAGVAGGDGIESMTRANVTTITLDRVNIETKGNNAAGLRLNHGTARLTDTVIVTHGERTKATGSVVGIYVDDLNDAARSAVVQMQGGGVTVHGKTSWGVGVVNGGVLEMDGVTLEKTSAGNGTAYAMNGGSLTFKNGNVNSAGAVAFWNVGDDSDVMIRNSTAKTTADTASVVIADAVKPGSTTRIDGSNKGSTTLEAAGDQSRLVLARRSADVEITNTDATANGDNSRGVWVLSQDAAQAIGGVAGGVGRFLIEGSDFTLDGKDSIGVLFQAGSVFAKEIPDPMDNTKTIPNPDYFKDAESINRADISDGSVFKLIKGYGVVANGGVNTLNVNNSTIDADRLAAAANLDKPGSGDTWGSKLTINASNGSRLFGHTHVSGDSRLTLNLQSGSTWTLKPSEAVTNAANGTRQSDVSVLNLNNAFIEFVPPVAGSNYQDTDNWQTLVVGSGDAGTSAVYNVNGTAHISMNALLNEGGELSNQFTDRLLIHGDVTGTTLVTVNPVANGEFGAVTSTEGAHMNHEGITIIQVSGKASPTSFKLNGEYVALGGKPWQYRLYAYGDHPDAVDKPHPDQRLVDGTGDDHWGFRLQNSAEPPPPPPPPPVPDDPDQLPPPPPPPPPPKPDPVPVPQVANYVLAPTALFAAGLQDIGTMHKRLGEIRDIQGDGVFVASMGDSDMRGHLDTARADGARHGEGFLRAYGHNAKQVNYRADTLSKGRYYDADIRYHAIQGGVSFTDVQNDTNRVRFGLAASVGNMTQTPKSMDGARKTDLKTWAVQPYMTWQHNSGAYVDVVGLLGKFKGSVTTTQRGRTAKIGGNRYGASVEAGLPITLENADITVTPQVQVAYQRLKFDATRDVDGFPVDVGVPKQLTVRAGAKVQKTLQGVPGIGSSNPVQVYGKLHMVKHFDKAQQVWLGANFTRAKMGQHLEAGAGVRASLAKGAGHAWVEVNRQQRVGTHGAQGWAFNVGVKLPF